MDGSTESKIEQAKPWVHSLLVVVRSTNSRELAEGLEDQ
jgi:hypothetical protein